MRACFLRLHVCDVIKFRDRDYARMRINDPRRHWRVWEGEASC